MRLIIIILLSSISINANSWKFGEHYDIGRLSYKNACAFIESELKEKSSKNSLKQEDARNFEALFHLLPCSEVDRHALTYGFRNALAADHIESPSDFFSLSGEKQALSWFNFGKLALENYQHFWPQVKRSWLEYHMEAIRLASQAHELLNNGDSIGAARILEKSLAYSAFADHFLQDSFSIGHSGFSRVSSLQNPSLIFHDYWNNTGRFLWGIEISDKSRDILLNKHKRLSILSEEIKAKENHIQWLAYGDGCLHYQSDAVRKPNKNKRDKNKKCKHENKKNFERLKVVNRDSIVAVMLAFIHGRDTGYSILVEKQFPAATESFKLESVYLTLSGSPEREKCDHRIAGTFLAGSRKDNEKCWFYLEQTYMEPVYPGTTISLTGTSLHNHKSSSYFGYHLVVSPHLKADLISWWPNSVRVYSSANITPLDLIYKDSEVGVYEELGISITLPNFYFGTPLSHELEIAVAQLSEKHFFLFKGGEVIERGVYTGVNSTIDILRANLTLGVGMFIPDYKQPKPDLKIQMMIGWSLGATGGGPLKRWK